MTSTSLNFAEFGGPVQPGWAWLRAFFLLLAFAAPNALAGGTLDKILANGDLSCGVSQDLPGFASRDADGRWQGLNVDFCRALAAAVLGDADKAKIVPLSSAARFPALLNKRVDVLAHTATLSFSREASIGLQFAGAYFFDGQSVMVPAKGGAGRLEDLNGASICIEKGTTSETVIEDALGRKGLKYTALPLENLTELGQAFFSGRCQALLNDRTRLQALLLAAPGGAGQYTILPGYLSKEPMGPAVRRGDEEWLTLVRWVLFALIEAEERDLRRSAVAALPEKIEDPALRRFLADSDRFGRGLKLPPGWVRRAVAAVGNYGEIFERNLGGGSPLKLERKHNHLWKNGGLLYSPPFR